MDRASRPIKRRREAFSPEPWARMRERVHQEQGGRCLVCRASLPLTGSVWERMHGCHVVGLGAGRSRHDASQWRNSRCNIIGACCGCHALLDSLPTTEARIELAADWSRAAGLPFDARQLLRLLIVERHAGRPAVTTCTPCAEGLHEACADNWLLADGPEPDAPVAAVACGCGHGGGATAGEDAK